MNQEKNVQSRVHGLAGLVSNTPLLEIEILFRGQERKLYAKAESLNMTGSIKDRMAYHIMAQGYKRGTLKPGDRIAEATSGNTGIAMAAIGRALGHPVTIFMPNWMSDERIDLIRSFGAEIVLISKKEGGFVGSIARAEELALTTPNVFLSRQFSNEDNCEAHYRSTGPEIWQQLLGQGSSPDAFVAGVGTGGTVMGTGLFLKEHNPAIKVCPLEPANSPTLSTGCKVGNHRIQGISDEFIPAILDLDSLDEIVHVDDGDAILMAQNLASELGLGVGISSGANLLGALQVQETLGPEAVIATVFPDSNKKYLSTDLLRDQPHKKDHLTPHVQLLSFRAIYRA